MRTGERMHMFLRVVQCVFYMIIIILSVLLFIFTLTQRYDPNAGQAVKTGVEDYYGSNKLDTACSQTDPDDFASHHPMRFTRPKNETGTEDEAGRVYEYCGWPDANVTYRGIMSFLMIPVCAFMFDRQRRRTPASGSAWILSKPKRIMKFLLIPCAAAILVSVVMLAIDAIPLVESVTWCRGALTDKYAGTSHEILCRYDPFLAIVLLETFIIVGWIISVVFIALRMKYFIQYMELEEEDSTDMPEVSSSRKSKFSFAAKKGKTRGRH
eukprot:TRINITY_DN3040_c1_g1_i2.p2 TRINITY_DN3040_c1_g1~~TRINITY_DN3040_c1_g1_i2.p2  ORF type:complete len:268 (-),score=77.92 TRINITY_DN3040_c1_g1_i2:258-1061(-)